MNLIYMSLSIRGSFNLWLGKYLPVCRDLVITSYQNHITQLLVLKVSLHLPEGLFCVVCSLEKLIWTVGAHPSVTTQSQPVKNQKIRVQFQTKRGHSESSNITLLLGMQWTHFKIGMSIYYYTHWWTYQLWIPVLACEERIISVLNVVFV